MAISISALEAMSWRSAVENFISDSPWLSDKHLPQLKALYAIATRLDEGRGVNAALISQFTLTQRTLMGKAPEVGGAGDMPPALPGLDGNGWGPETPDDRDYS